MAKSKEDSRDIRPLWRVTLHGAPEWHVRANTQTEAVSAYKQAVGIIDSDHPFVAVKLDAPTVTKVPDLLSEPTVAEGAK